MSEQKVSSVGWGFWLQWVLASTVGAVMVDLVLHGSNFLFADWHVAINVIIVASWLVAAALIGIMQWRVLRKQISIGTVWLWISSISWAIGILVLFFMLLFGIGGPMVGGATLTSGTFVGLVVGSIQYIVLRRQVSQAGWWVLASTAGWVIVGWSIAWHGWNLWKLFGWSSGGFVAFGIGHALYGAITGFALVWLLRRPRP